MSELLPQQAPLRIARATGKITRKQLDGLDHLVVVVARGTRQQVWDGIPDGPHLAALMRRAGKDSPAIIRSRLRNDNGTGITVGTLAHHGKRAPGTFDLLRLAGELIGDAMTGSPGRIGLLVAGLDAQTCAAMREALVAAAGAHGFRMPAFPGKGKKGTQGKASLREVVLLSDDGSLDTRRALAAQEGANLARWLTALPSNRLTAGAYREILAELAEHHDWSMRFLDIAALRRLGAGAFLAVAQGNATKDAGIVHLSWRPGGRTQPDVALVGKGIIFDTGGTNLKPFKSMLDMHEDMCGSATALGVLIALTRLKAPIAVDCWLAITENRMSPEGYKPRDVVTAADGTTIEIIHTDAEGRLALADTLVLAGREKPGLIVDYATLTGACINAVSERYSGVFSNRPALLELLTAVGRASGERVWPFPLDEDFDDDLKSSVADVLQCSPESEADHILAARFLQRFVPEEAAWVHIDLSAASRKKGLGHVPGGPTGFGVRYTLKLLLDEQPALRAALAAAPRS